MRFMNEYDLEYARARFTHAGTPNRLGLVIAVQRLAEWANTHSDGWSYWPKPCRAAARAIELIESRTSRENRIQEENDITDAEMIAAVRPIKSFMTRHASLFSVEDRELILRSVS